MSSYLAFSPLPGESHPSPSAVCFLWHFPPIARVTSHIPDKRQVTIRYFGLYGNAYRGKVRKASLGPFPLRMVEDELRRLPAKVWAEMIRKVYEVDPLLGPQCGGPMRIIAFLTDYSVLDRIIELTSDHAAIYDP